MFYKKTQFRSSSCNAVFSRYPEAATGGVLPKNKVFTNFSNFKWSKTLVMESLFNKVAGRKPATLFNRDSNTGAFPAKFTTFLKTLFLQNFFFSLKIFFCSHQLFASSHIYNVVSTFTNVEKLDVEKSDVVSTFSKAVNMKVDIDNVDFTLYNVVHFNVEIHNDVSTLI